MPYRFPRRPLLERKTMTMDQAVKIAAKKQGITPSQFKRNAIGEALYGYGLPIKPDWKNK